MHSWENLKIVFLFLISGSSWDSEFFFSFKSKHVLSLIMVHLSLDCFKRRGDWGQQKRIVNSPTDLVVWSTWWQRQQYQQTYNIFRRWGDLGQQKQINSLWTEKSIVKSRTDSIVGGTWCQSKQYQQFLDTFRRRGEWGQQKQIIKSPFDRFNRRQHLKAEEMHH